MIESASQTPPAVGAQLEAETGAEPLLGAERYGGRFQFSGSLRSRAARGTLINAGFMVMDQRVFEGWKGPSLERHSLPALSDRRELFAYLHTGFWRSMDTYKDAVELTALCEQPPPPWAAPPGVSR